MNKSLVLLSGGQDSTTCLYWAKKTFDSVEAISFDYNQKHQIEIEKAQIIAQKAGARWSLLKAPEMLGTSPLVNPNHNVCSYRSVEELPEGIEPTFVPCRNILFLTMAANFAVSKDICNIVTGVCQVDYGGYPDCRAEFIFHMQRTLNLGIFGHSFEWNNVPHKQLKIHTPLMYLSKKETVLLAKDLGCVAALIDSHTCYEGKSPPCGSCHSCLLRERGFKEAGIEDPLIKKEDK